MRREVLAFESRVVEDRAGVLRDVERNVARLVAGQDGVDGRNDVRVHLGVVVHIASDQSAVADVCGHQREHRGLHAGDDAVGIGDGNGVVADFFGVMPRREEYARAADVDAVERIQQRFGRHFVRRIEPVVDLREFAVQQFAQVAVGLLVDIAAVADEDQRIHARNHPAHQFDVLAQVERRADEGDVVGHGFVAQRLPLFGAQRTAFEEGFFGSYIVCFRTEDQRHAGPGLFHEVAQHGDRGAQQHQHPGRILAVFPQQVIFEGLDLADFMVFDRHQQRVHVLDVDLEIVHLVDVRDDVVDDVAAPGCRFGVGVQDQHVVALVARGAARGFGEGVCQQAAENQDSRQGLEGNAERFLQKIHLLGMEEPDRTGCDAKIQ